jgi:hypothetical protein
MEERKGNKLRQRNQNKIKRKDTTKEGVKDRNEIKGMKTEN